METGLPLFQINVSNQDEVVIKLNFKREHYHKYEHNLDKLKVKFNGKVVTFNTLSYRVGPTRSAMHHEDGIFIVAGPNVRKDYHHEDEANIVDILPTILRASKIKIPNNLDGKVLNIFN